MFETIIYILVTVFSLIVLYAIVVFVYAFFKKDKKL